MIPTWAWWGMISVGLCGLGWLWGRRSRPQGPAGHGPWDRSWAVYFSPNGGATHAILENIRGAQRTILVHAYVLYSTRLAGALVHATNEVSRCTCSSMPPRSCIIPPSRPSHAWRRGSRSPSMRSIHGRTIK